MNNGPNINMRELNGRENRNNLGQNKNGIKQLLTIPGLAEQLAQRLGEGEAHISKKIPLQLPNGDTIKLDNAIFTLNDKEGNPHAFMVGKQIAKTEKSVVKYAYDLATGAEVAFKRSQEDPTVDSITQACLQREEIREINALIQFNQFRGHNVIISGVNKITNANKVKHCLASDLISGKNIDTVIKDKNEAAKYGDEFEDNFMDIVEIAFNFCLKIQKQFHDQDLLHRDIKPANMMMYKDQHGLHVEGIDFGGVVRESEIEQDEDREYGTSEFMAPELLDNIACHSRATDAYAVGKSLAEMLQILNAVRYARDYKLEKKTYTQIKEKLTEIVEGLTQKDPQARLTLPEALSKFAEMAEIDPEIFSIKSEIKDDLVVKLGKLSL